MEKEGLPKKLACTICLTYRKRIHSAGCKESEIPTLNKREFLAIRANT